MTFKQKLKVMTTQEKSELFFSLWDDYEYIKEYIRNGHPSNSDFLRLLRRCSVLEQQMWAILNYGKEDV